MSPIILIAMLWVDMTKETKKNDRQKILIGTNRKARRDFVILDRHEAGIALLGTEVKSLRDGKVDLTPSYARIENMQAVLYELHIKPYEYGNRFNHDPRRPRKLLLHANEIRRLYSQVTIKGKTLIPVSIYFNKRGKVKVEIAVCQGKHVADKRETLKRKTADLETRRALSGKT